MLQSNSRESSTVAPPPLRRRMRVAARRNAEVYFTAPPHIRNRGNIYRGEDKYPHFLRVMLDVALSYSRAETSASIVSALLYEPPRIP